MAQWIFCEERLTWCWHWSFFTVGNIQMFFESATFLSEPTMQFCVLHLSWNIWILPTVKKLQCQHHVNLSSQKIHWAIIGCRTCASHCFELTLRLLQTFDFYSCTVYFCCSCCNIVCLISLALRSGNYWFVFYVVDFFCVHLDVQIESSPLAEPFPQALICIFASALTLTYIYNATMSNTKERDMINPLPRPQSFLTLDMFVSTFTKSNLNFHP
jgi:hypothetical protein